MGLRDILRREFSPANMTSRASRYDAADRVKADLDLWVDYGDPAVLEQILGGLRPFAIATTSPNTEEPS